MLSLLILRCSYAVESSCHMLFSCPSSKAVWKNSSFCQLIKSLLHLLLSKILFGVIWNLQPDCFCSFDLILWALWNDRNRVLHGGKEWEFTLIISSALYLIEEYGQVVHLHNRPIVHHSPLTRWTAPLAGAVKFNSDATVLVSESHVGVAGVFRDSQGCVLAAFSCKIFSSFETVNY
ncbi:hypothetical protein PanWU01x14_222990 [Parasponia andersonii]|uniref:RNase H type-1 domain-containing protein n=1 Tax=Parasponia andersonii TaxID=3476 RepID=A0A2P5BNW7_PARAD|nr:hypothetical protein PanWU01x14_222990 [Parasponia andersonii]